MLKRTLLGGLLTVLMISGVFVFKAWANPDVSVTAATGGTGISIDTTSASGGSHTGTTLGNIIITEGAVGDIGLGSHTFTVPAGWNFTSDFVTIAVGGATDLTVGNISINSIDGTTLSFNVNHISTTGTATLTFSGIKVHPTGTTVLSAADITHSGASILGVSGSTNFGTLSTMHGTATKYVVIDPTDGTVAAPVTVTVQLQDQFGIVVTTGADKDKDVTLATNGSATGGGVVNIANGVGTRDISDTVAETVTLSLNTPVLVGADVTSTQNLVFAAGAANHAHVTAITDPVVAGVASDVTVTIHDVNSNVATSYTGTVHFTSTDAQAVLPSDYAFVSGDNGVHTFTGGVTMKTSGEQTVTATDTVTGTINGTQADVTVTHAVANKVLFLIRPMVQLMLI